MHLLITDIFLNTTYRYVSCIEKLARLSIHGAKKCTRNSPLYRMTGRLMTCSRGEVACKLPLAYDFPSSDVMACCY